MGRQWICDVCKQPGEPFLSESNRRVQVSTVSRDVELCRACVLKEVTIMLGDRKQILQEGGEIASGQRA